MNEEQVNNISACLENYRITCTTLRMMTNVTQLTKEQCTRLLKILKPRSFYIDSDGSNRYEAIFQAKELVSVVFFPKK